MDHNSHRRPSTASTPARPGTRTPPGPPHSPGGFYGTPTHSTALLDHASPLSSPGLTPGYAPPLAPFARGSDGSRHSRNSMLSTYSDSPYGEQGVRTSSMVDKWALGPDPRSWGTNLNFDTVEDDDELHKPETTSRALNRNGGLVSARGAANLGCIALLALSLLALFLAYPITKFYGTTPLGTLGGFGLGGTNATGQVPDIQNRRALIDPDTPQAARSRPALNGGGDMELVFSDEFNTDGRTFYPGDDPFWEAVDLHYWATGNAEWYDPAAVTTGGGSLAITYSANPENGLNYTGGMIQSWNKFCFTGGYIEVSVMFPGFPQYAGMWPAVWTMGNLGRAGYGATTDGLWPYTYDTCDIGALPNQTMGGPNPLPGTYGDPLSTAAGQRLSRCTCNSDAHLHPGPRHKDGSLVGRSAPEIDIFEQQVGTVAKGAPEVSQSGQWAPFNGNQYDWQGGHDGDWTVYDTSKTVMNSYNGSDLQQPTSYITEIDANCFERTGQCYGQHGFEYKPGYDVDGGYITWVADGKESWTLNAAAMGADPRSGIDARPIPMEPMYILMNLGMSLSFVPDPDPKLLSTFPITMYVDYIRVYQPKGAKNIGCDPPGFPTTAYIAQYSEMYQSPNYTTFGPATNQYQIAFNQTKPRNRLTDQC